MKLNNFTVIVLAIIYYKSKILIGKRAKKDKDIVKLTWVFPGGRPKHEELESAVKREIKEETNLNIASAELIFARTYPEKRDLLSLFYFCKVNNIKNTKPQSDLSELKWVKPTDVKNYFTTSIYPTVYNFLKKLEVNTHV